MNKKHNEKRLVVSTLETESNERHYIKFVSFLGSEPYCKTVENLSEATWFDEPETVEYVLKNFFLIKPKIHLVELSIQVKETIKDDIQKYKTFAELLEQKQ